MTKPPQVYGKMVRDHELIVIGKVFDLVATLKPDRREFAVEYVKSRLNDMPVIAQVEDNTEDGEPLMFPPRSERHPDSAA